MAAEEKEEGETDRRPMGELRRLERELRALHAALVEVADVLHRAEHLELGLVWREGHARDVGPDLACAPQHD
eukprot:4910356-Pyramimonas_sp.AAC.1